MLIISRRLVPYTHFQSAQLTGRNILSQLNGVAKQRAVVSDCMSSKLTMGIILLVIKILHDCMYPNPRNCVSILDIGSCRFLSSTACMRGLRNDFDHQLSQPMRPWHPQPNTGGAPCLGDL